MCIRDRLFHNDTWSRPLHSDRNPRRDPSARRYTRPPLGTPVSPSPSLIQFLRAYRFGLHSSFNPPLRANLSSTRASEGHAHSASSNQSFDDLSKLGVI